MSHDAIQPLYAAIGTTTSHGQVRGVIEQDRRSSGG